LIFENQRAFRHLINGQCLCAFVAMCYARSKRFSIWSRRGERVNRGDRDL